MHVLMFILTIPALVIIAITALVRANHLGLLRKDRTEPSDWHQWLRALGLLLAGVTALAVLVWPLWGHVPAIPLWAFAMLYGMTFTWLTTPGMPPWWNIITGNYSRIRWPL